MLGSINADAQEAAFAEDEACGCRGRDGAMERLDVVALEGSWWVLVVCGARSSRRTEEGLAMRCSRGVDLQCEAHGRHGCHHVEIE